MTSTALKLNTTRKRHFRNISFFSPLSLQFLCTGFQTVLSISLSYIAYVNQREEYKIFYARTSCKENIHINTLKQTENAHKSWK